METMQYKVFLGSIEISKEDKILYGKLLHINGLITYEAENFSELEAAFHDAVDDYLADCEESGVEPQRSCSGAFNIRVKPEKHRQLLFISSIQNIKLNALVAEGVDLVITKYATEHAKLEAYKVFKFNWEHNPEMRKNAINWTLEKMSKSQFVSGEENNYENANP